MNAPGNREHFNSEMFHGFDFDGTMLRIGSMNLMLHGIEDPKIEARDSLSEDHAGITEAFTLILANPPFKGSLEKSTIAKDLTKIISTTKTELLFIALFLRLLKIGGRAAVIVPDGVLFGSSTAHKKMREVLVEEHKLDGVISMPSGVFKPYAGVSTAVLIFTKTGAGGTDYVWFYDMEADGLSLDDKRQPVEENDIPDLLQRWKARNPQQDTDRTGKAFFVSKNEIKANGYDLSINRLNQLNWRDYLTQQNPVAAALMAKMNIAVEERPQVKAECLRLLITLKLDPARMQLISGFVDVYLRLNAEENQTFRDAADRMGLLKEEKYMEIMTSWEQEALEKVALNVLRMGMTVEVTVQLTGLTAERVRQLQAQLQKQD